MKDLWFNHFRKAFSDSRGGIAVMAAFLFIPLILGAGLAVDLARLVVAQTTLQGSVDSAALAGASAWQGAAGTVSTTAIATNYFNKTVQSSGVTVTGAPAVTAGNGTYNGQQTYNVTVSASATLKTVFMAMGGIDTVSLSATATAANPSVHPVVTLLDQPSAAADWNSVYMYAVPTGSNGQPDFTKMPAYSSFYEIDTNCNSADPDWSSNSQCNGGIGATMPTTTGFPTVSATTPLAFLFVNMNNGQAASGQTLYTGSSYGQTTGSYHLLNTEWMNTAVGVNSVYGPSYQTDNSAALIYQITGYQISQPATNYSQINNHTPTGNLPGPNCALIIQNVNPLSLPTSPPSAYIGHCMENSDPGTGAQYANMSCSQIAGRTFYYWWNDMGAPQDNYNYDDIAYTLQCLPGTGTPNGGTIKNNQVSNGTTTLTVSLVQ